MERSNFLSSFLDATKALFEKPMTTEDFIIAESWARMWIGYQKYGTLGFPSSMGTTTGTESGAITTGDPKTGVAA